MLQYHKSQKYHMNCALILPYHGESCCDCPDHR